MFRSAFLGLLIACLPALAQPKTKGKEITATPVDQLKVAKGFKAELLYTVPKDKEGSWVSMCTLPDGRLIVSDQYDKGLFIVNVRRQTIRYGPGITLGIRQFVRGRERRSQERVVSSHSRQR
jgi:putative hemolysin